MTVVDARRYSRNSGATSDESEIGHSGKLLREDRAHALLVLVVDVGVEEADRYRLDTFPPQDRRCVAHGVFLERPQHLALRAEPLADDDGAVAGDERLRLLELGVVEGRPYLPRDLEQVAEAFGGDEAAARDLPLDDRIRRDGGGVHDERHVTRVDRRPRRAPALPPA